MCFVQFLSKPAASRLIPGPVRGDVRLEGSVLPNELAGWTQRGFKPAPAPESLRQGQYWWVHQWIYEQRGMAAVVSFDQLGEDQWHELTWCYRDNDWIVRERSVREIPEDGSRCIVAILEKDNAEKALLVFSVFFEDGAWATPPEVNLLNLNAVSRTSGFLGKAKERFDPVISFSDPDSGHTRALQCQVLVSGVAVDSAAVISEAVQLHLETRQRFRNRWLVHAKSLSPALGLPQSDN